MTTHRCDQGVATTMRKRDIEREKKEREKESVCVCMCVCVYFLQDSAGQEAGALEQRD